VQTSSAESRRAVTALGRPIEVVAFDLDNTLYDEGQYFAAAFRTIAPALAREAGVDESHVLGRLEGTLAARGRHYHRLFNDVLDELGLDVKAHLADVLAMFRGVSTPLVLFPGALDLLDDLGALCRLGLITSGMREVQENKLALLGIARRFERVVFSSTLPENKPGQMPFRTLLGAMGVEPHHAAYVGDNPLADFRGPNELGMLTVRVRNPEFDGTVVPRDCDAQLTVEKTEDLRRLFLRGG
jgi:putative hydrolase of the HAD superfamily